MKTFLKTYILLFLSVTAVFAQGTAGTNAKYEYRTLIDMQTAGILEKGFAGLVFDIMPNGVLIAQIEAGAFNNFSFGISYGGSNVIGTGNISWYKWPAIYVKFRFMDETRVIPALAVGFDSQGKGVYDKELDRYQIKSPGFFLAASKNFELLGYFSIHGMINYTLERDDNDKDLNLAFGIEKTIGGPVSFYAEYDFAINDNNPLSFGEGKGYLNVGLRWSLAQGFTIGLDLRDLLSNQKLNAYRADRALYIEYISSIF
ncbi:hypothetical protein MNBD_IGNAVI01-2877 [hydrothermal vent metagenome]|uniref:Uncharacterized protein n=1 Tax=hydrothermal vent metagenome TaxID=652676 RepID=A0A3B1CM63_9ZZZZ